MGKIELSQSKKEKLGNNLKIGIYKELREKSFITDAEFQILSEK